jgi:hypothetical protein
VFGFVFAASPAGNAAVTASFLPGPGIVSVFGDAQDNTITVSSNAAGEA